MSAVEQDISIGANFPLLIRSGDEDMSDSDLLPKNMFQRYTYSLGGDGEEKEREGGEEGRGRGGKGERRGGGGGEGQRGEGGEEEMEGVHTCHNVSLSLQLCEEELKI